MTDPTPAAIRLAEAAVPPQEVVLTNEMSFSEQQAVIDSAKDERSDQVHIAARALDDAGVREAVEKINEAKKYPYKGDILILIRLLDGALSALTGTHEASDDK